MADRPDPDPDPDKDKDKDDVLGIGIEEDDGDSNDDDSDSDDGVLFQQPTILMGGGPNNGGRGIPLAAKPPALLSWQQDAILECLQLAVQSHDAPRTAFPDMLTWNAPPLFPSPAQEQQEQQQGQQQGQQEQQQQEQPSETMDAGNPSKQGNDGSWAPTTTTTTMTATATATATTTEATSDPANELTGWEPKELQLPPWAAAADLTERERASITVTAKGQ
jgi:hypothetical protein